jgi:predicted DNA-binding transcriptional regulator AlpA
MSIFEAQIKTLLDQLSEAISVLDVKDCPAIIGYLEQLKALAWSRINAIQALSPAPTQPLHERYLSVKEVAERFHVSDKWLYRHKKNMPHSQPTKKTLRFPEGPIQRWFASRKQKDQ